MRARVLLSVSFFAVLVFPAAGFADSASIKFENDNAESVRQLQVDAGYKEDPQHLIKEKSPFALFPELQRCGGPANISMTWRPLEDRMTFSVDENSKDKSISAETQGKVSSVTALYPPFELIGSEGTMPESLLYSGPHAEQIRQTTAPYMEAIKLLLIDKNKPAALKKLQAVKKYCDEHELPGYLPKPYVPAPPVAPSPPPAPPPVANVAPTSTMTTVGAGKLMTSEQAVPAFKSHMACYHALEKLPGVGGLPAILAKGVKFPTVTFAELVRTGPKIVGIYTFSDAMGSSYHPLSKAALDSPACKKRYLYKFQGHLTWKNGEPAESAGIAADYNPPEKIEPFSAADFDGRKKDYDPSCVLEISDRNHGRFDSSTGKVLTLRFNRMIASLPAAVKASGSKKAPYLAAIDACLATEAYTEAAAREAVVGIRSEIAALPEGTGGGVAPGLGGGGAQ